MEKIIQAPWNTKQVKLANDWQNNKNCLPFKCKKYGCKRKLVATKAGFCCDCGYCQNYAPEYIFHDSWKELANMTKEDMVKLLADHSSNED